MTPKVEGYIRKNKRWEAELSALRRILLQSELSEEVKWRVPCYTWAGRNIVLLGAFKSGCVLNFVQGALLSDPHRLLVRPGPHTRGARVIRFTGADEIVQRQAILQAYVQEAIALEKAGRKVDYQKEPALPAPPELEATLARDPALKRAFAALTPGRRRGYLLHFAQAKQSSTRAARVERCRARILAGRGLHDPAD
jgi:uncharacterized protein YdeI (YjbR/CyaY-like superfamily)